MADVFPSTMPPGFRASLNEWTPNCRIGYIHACPVTMVLCNTLRNEFKVHTFSGAVALECSSCTVTLARHASLTVHVGIKHVCNIFPWPLALTTGTTPRLPTHWVPRLFDNCGPGYCGWKLTYMANQCKNTCSLSVGVLQGESSKRLVPPRNTKDMKDLQSTQTTVYRHNSQTKHLALSKGQPGSQDTQHQSAQLLCTPSAQQPPAMSTHTQLGHHQILSPNAARCEAQAG